MLPPTHQKTYEKFKQSLVKLMEWQSEGQFSPKWGRDLSQLLLKAHTIFQFEVLVLDNEQLPPDLVYVLQSCETEIHKQLRLLLMDAHYLQSARHPETIHNRIELFRDRLSRLINDCHQLLQ
ncbi:MAG: heterocyst frequency control protein PatD [Cyanobacteria bacterium LVE1205-1]|jgi:hypothetical protein